MNLNNQSHPFIRVQGSGSTGCLLNSNCQDERQPIDLITGLLLTSVHFSGQFALGKDHQRDLYLWGLCNTKIIQKPLCIKKVVSRVSCGWNHALIESQQQLFGMGNNTNGQLGIVHENAFVIEPVLLWKEKVDLFCAGFRQSYLVVSDDLYGCGESKKYQLGIATTKPIKWQSIVSKISSYVGDNLSQIKCGKRFLLMLAHSGDLFALGSNDQNCFNQSELSYCLQPQLIAKNIYRFACGWAHTILLTNNREIYSYGRNNLGQLGHEKNTECIQFDLEQGEVITEIISGTEFAFALTSHTRAYTWGWNQHYNLINSEQKILSKPVLLVHPDKIMAIVTHAAITAFYY